MRFEFFDRVGIEIGTARNHELELRWQLFGPKQTCRGFLPWEIDVRTAPGRFRPKNAIGFEAAFDDQSLYLLDRQRRAVRLSGDLFGSRIAVEAEPSIDPKWLTGLLEDLLFLKWVQAGVLPLHAGCVEWAGRCYVCAGWAGTGKTALVLSAATSGGHAVADEWSLIVEGRIFPYRCDLLLMPYDIAAFPAAAGVGLMGRLLVRAHVRLPSRRTDGRRLTPSYGQSSAVDEIIYVQRTTQAPTRLEPLAGESLIESLWASFYRERRRLFSVLAWRGLAGFGVDDGQFQLRRWYADAASGLPQPFRRLYWAVNDDALQALQRLAEQDALL